MHLANRRAWLRATMALGAAGLIPTRRGRAQEPGPMLRLGEVAPEPLTIRSVELLRDGRRWFVRATAGDGAVGVAPCSGRIAYFYPILVQRVAPYFVGKDARDLESLVDGVYVFNSNYKLGLPMFCCLAWIEAALFDLLGKVAGRSVGELLGGVIRREVPVYLSSLRRDTTPEEEVAWLAPRLEATGARAVKIKVGGRMSRNRDASPGRTDRLVPLAREAFGPDIDICADANGSYDASKGIEVGRLMEEYDYHFFEEPCPFTDLDGTEAVADALEMTVAGGEQDTRYHTFERMTADRIVDLVQPDLTYNGGFIRTLRVARLAAEAGLQVTPHSPQPGANPVYMLQFASAVPNLGPYQEFRGDIIESPDWFAPAFEVRGGALRVPDGAGLGLEIDPAVLGRARRVDG